MIKLYRVDELQTFQLEIYVDFNDLDIMRKICAREDSFTFESKC